MTLLFLFFAFLASVGAGFVNAIAGGGTLISFPILTALGLSPVAANITNTIALCPGYFSGAYAQRKDFNAQKKRLWMLLPFGIAGGVAGGLILLNTSEKMFNNLVPFLILAAAIILALQVKVKKWVNSRSISKKHSKFQWTLFVMVLIAAIYGGYFGAGLGIILMAVLGLMMDDSLTQLNVLKQALSFSINVPAAIYFAFSDRVEWTVVAVMAVGAIAGATIGGKLAGKIKPGLLRVIIVITGVVVAGVFFYRNFIQ